MLSSANWIRLRRALVRNTISWTVKGLLWNLPRLRLRAARPLWGSSPAETKPPLPPSPSAVFALFCIYFLYCFLMNAKHGVEEQEAERVFWGGRSGGKPGCCGPYLSSGCCKAGCPRALVLGRKAKGKKDVLFSQWPWGRMTRGAGGDADPNVAARGAKDTPKPPPLCRGRDQGLHAASCPGSPLLSLAPSCRCDAQQ